MADTRTERQKLASRWGALKSERESWMSVYQDITDNLLPYSGRYFVQDRNRGERRTGSIYDRTATGDLRILCAGLMAGMSSPARPFFNLTTFDAELDESAGVKRWLADVRRLMLMIFAKSNTYRALHNSYEELGAFGTSATVVLPNYKNVLHQYPVTTGEFAISTNAEGHVDTLYREFEKTVGQLHEEFGKENLSKTVQSLADQGKWDTWVPIIHAIEPRRARDAQKRDARNMRFKSVYWEVGGDGDGFLRESGFHDFPALCPRWAASGGDIYGNSPAMEALGDIRQLQHEQLRKSQGIDYMTKPPLQAPSSLKNGEINGLPGGFTFVDMTGPQGSVKNLFDVRLDLSHLLSDIQDVRQRIAGAFYSDLFMMIASQPVGRMTATEVAERHEEKLLMLGPVLERLHGEILSPLIEITFARMVEAGIVPVPPKELQDVELNVEFVSMLAQAQRAVATNSIDRFVMSLGQVATIKPEVLDKLDADQWADAYSDMLGIDPDMIVPGDQVAIIRRQRAEAAQAQQQAQQAQQMADTAAKLANARTDQPSALTDVTRMFAGYT